MHGAEEKKAKMRKARIRLDATQLNSRHSRAQRVASCAEDSGLRVTRSLRREKVFYENAICTSCVLRVKRGSGLVWSVLEAWLEGRRRPIASGVLRISLALNRELVSSHHIASPRTDSSLGPMPLLRLVSCSFASSCTCHQPQHHSGRVSPCKLR